MRGRYFTTAGLHLICIWCKGREGWTFNPPTHVLINLHTIYISFAYLSLPPAPLEYSPTLTGRRRNQSVPEASFLGFGFPSRTLPNSTPRPEVVSNGHTRRLDRQSPGFRRERSRRRCGRMKLLTHNLLTSHVRGLRPGGGYPLGIQVPSPAPSRLPRGHGRSFPPPGPP